MRLEENKYWISLADSDVLLWAQGLAVNSKFEVDICEPDVSPLQLQGPRSQDILAEIFGENIRELKYYWLREVNLKGMELIISRTGWSSELGYEIYLQDSSRGNELWEIIMAAGQNFGLQPGHTSTIRRIEGGMLSYHADMDLNTNPFELEMDRLVELDVEHDFVGKNALEEIKRKGISRRQVGLIIDGDLLHMPNTKFWPLSIGGEIVGKVTSAVYSPRLKKNIALGMVSNQFSEIGMTLKVRIQDQLRNAEVIQKPFYDPRKQITKS